MNPSMIARLPFLGAGLGHRREIHEGIMASEGEVDFVEIITEKYIGATPRALAALEEVADKFTIIPHGVSLSIGTASPVSKTFLRNIKEVCDLVHAPYYSDHLAVTQSAGIDLGHLSPIIYDEANLRNVIANVNRVQDYLGLPFVMENITETHLLPGSTIDGAEFMHRVVDATGCAMLLDLANLYINSVNLEFDAIAYAQRLPLASVVQVHLAGGIWSRGKLIDSHSESVPERVWEIFSALLPQMNVKAALLERDDNYPDIAELIEELHMARRLMAASSVAPALAA